MKRILKIVLSGLILVCSILPNEVKAETITQLNLEVGKTYRIQCTTKKRLRSYSISNTNVEYYFNQNEETAAAVLSEKKEPEDMTYRPMESGDYIDIKLKSGQLFLYTLIDDSLGFNIDSQKDDFNKYFTVTELTHDPLKKYGLSEGSSLSLDNQTILQNATSKKYYFTGTELSGIRTTTNYYYNSKFGYDIIEDTYDLKESENYWRPLKEGNIDKYIVINGQAVLYLGWEVADELVINANSSVEIDADDFLEKNDDPNDNNDFKESKSFTEKEIYTIYPESLTNETDTIIEKALDYTTGILNNRTEADDLYASFKSASSDISKAIEYLTNRGIEYFFKNNLMDRKEEYIDEVVLELLYLASEDENIMVSAMEKLHDKYDTTYKNIKKSLKFSEKYNIDYDQWATILTQNIPAGDIESKAEISKSVKKSYEGWDKSINKVFKNIDNSIDFIDVLLVNVQVEQIKIELLEHLINSLPPEHTIQKGLLRLKNKLNKNLWTNSLNDFLEDKIIENTCDFILNNGVSMRLDITGTETLSSRSFALFAGKYIVESFGKSLDGPIDSDIIKATVYETTTFSLFNALITKRTEFVNAYENSQPIDNIDDSIQDYKMTYGLFISSCINYVKAAENLGDNFDKEKLDVFIVQLKSLNYEHYLNNCIKKINKNTFNFMWRSTPNGISITGISEQNKTKTANILYDGATTETILVIPDEINGEKVTSIENGAISGEYEGIILGKNITTLEDDSISTTDAIDYIYINKELNNYKNNSINADDNTLLLSSSADFSLNYAGQGKLSDYIIDIDSLSIEKMPD